MYTNLKMSAKEDRQVYHAAHKCEKRLRKLLALCSTMNENDFRLSRDISQQFALWSGYLGVFADQNISLDARLERAPDVKELVLQLLGILQSDTDYGKRIAFYGVFNNMKITWHHLVTNHHFMYQFYHRRGRDEGTTPPLSHKWHASL